MNETQSTSSQPLQYKNYSEAVRDQQRIHDEWSQTRLQVITQFETDIAYRACVLVLCKEDPIYFFQHFLWTYDPRLLEGRQVVPFIPYDYQEELIRWMEEAITSTQGQAAKENLLIEKSRDMGASWTVLGFLLWRWLFKGSSFLIISRKEEEVDKKGDLDTPFEKLRFMFSRLPDGMKPTGFTNSEHNKFMLLVNPKGGEIAGESSNRHTGRGGRKTMVVFDEQQAMGKNDEAAYRACAQTTNVRLSIGTPNGPVGLYYRLANNKEGEKDKLVKVNKKRLHWKIHPVKAAGACLNEHGRWTSEWYEAQCSSMSAEDVAAELDISYATSVRGLIFPEYKEIHRFKVNVIVKRLIGDENTRILRVWDPGLTFANVWMQKDRYGRCLVLRELVLTDANIHQQADAVEEISAELQRLYKPPMFDDCGDPAGSSRTSSGQDQPEYATLLEKYGIDVDYLFMAEMPARLRVKSRITAIKNLMSRICFQTETPMLVVDAEACPYLDEALASKYRWKIDQYTKTVYEGKVNEEHPSEDVVDCLGYGVIYKWGLAISEKKVSTEIRENDIEWDEMSRGVR